MDTDIEAIKFYAYHYIVLPYIALSLTLVLIYGCIRTIEISPKTPTDVQKVLLITSHPDDECMFFSPILQNLAGQGHFIHVLCLSTGNYYGLGTVRTSEIIRSCAALGVPESNVYVYNSSLLPDNPDVMWSTLDVENVILPVIYYLQPHMVISFDGYGVSGHSNHISINQAMQSLCQKSRLPNFIRVFQLESTNILRKYVSLLDLPISLLTSKHVAVSSPWRLIKSWWAMVCHRSQFVWFRVLYIMFSRYMLVNTLEEICHHGDC